MKALWRTFYHLKRQHVHAWSDYSCIWLECEDTPQFTQSPTLECRPLAVGVEEDCSATCPGRVSCFSPSTNQLLIEADTEILLRMPSYLQKKYKENIFQTYPNRIYIRPGYSKEDNFEKLQGSWLGPTGKETVRWDLNVVVHMDLRGQNLKPRF